MSTEFTLPEGKAEELAYVAKSLAWKGQNPDLAKEANTFYIETLRKQAQDELMAELNKIPAALRGDFEARITGLATASHSTIEALKSRIKADIATAAAIHETEQNTHDSEMSEHARHAAYEAEMKKAYDWFKAHGYGDEDFEKKRAKEEEKLAKLKPESKEYYAQEMKIAQMDKEHWGEVAIETKKDGNAEATSFAKDLERKAEDERKRLEEDIKRKKAPNQESRQAPDKEPNQKGGGENVVTTTDHSEGFSHGLSSGKTSNKSASLIV